MVEACTGILGRGSGTLPILLGDTEAYQEVIDALRELAEPSPPRDKVKAAIERARRACGLDYWRVFDIWYRKARRIEPREIAAIEDARKQKLREATRNELHELRTRIVRMEAMLARIDPDFRCRDIAADRARCVELDRDKGGRVRAGGRL